MKWFIEDIREGETTKFIQAIQEEYYHDSVNIINIKNHEYQEYCNNNIEPASIVFGSIALCTYMQRYRDKHNISPGVLYSSKEAYSCLTYYKEYGNHLLNSDYIIIPYYDLKRKTNEIYQHSGINSTIFIRPNNPNKIWTGETINKANFHNWVDRQIGFGKFAANELAYISKPINIHEEYRCVVNKEGYITGSLYRKGITHLTSTEVPNSVIQKCNATSHLYTPDILYVMDIGLVEENYSLTPYIIEIGPIACAGLYDCDMNKIVKHIRTALTPCIYDTNGDGDCQHCFKRGGCQNMGGPYQVKSKYPPGTPECIYAGSNQNKGGATLFLQPNPIPCCKPIENGPTYTNMINSFVNTLISASYHAMPINH